MAALLDVTTLPTGRNGRLLAVGLAVAVLGVCWLAIVDPLVGLYRSREQALEHRTDYARHMQAIAASLPLVERQAASARSEALPTNMILAGNSDPVAGATLESLIDGLTHDAGATLISTEAAPVVQTGAFRRIGLHVTARAPWSKLIAMLAAVEKAEPRMSISELQIQAGPLGGAEQLLDMSLSVSAFRAGTAAATTPTDTTAGTPTDASAEP